ncbi:hypothetical protein NQ318_011359 [Aromia moschata]|uniref:Major facilitator superfamily (MFS) profile domain-containing protein n=1 Tax=Aromia moschata TaxID=1265417 RepID=A0AAV8YT81_9CUCU|nr:hypothetical protein NQ318_011359 [Aromia moschata]
MTAQKLENLTIFKGTLTQLVAVITGSLFAISDGMTYTWTAPMIPYLISDESHIKTTLHEAEWLETTVMAGACCGLPLTIYLVDKIGRKRSLLLASSTMVVTWTAIALGTNMIYLFVARFVAGMAGDMAFVAAPMYVAEIADKKIRGFLSGLIYLMMLIGCVLMYSVGPYLPFYTAPVIGICVTLLEVVTFSFMPESPYYLFYKNKPEEAKNSLHFFRPKVDTDRELKDISRAIERQKTERGRVQDLILVDSNRKGIVIMTILNGGQHLCAISVILMNLHMILEAAGSIYMESSLAAIVFSVIMLVSAGFASLQVDKYGRKVLLISSSILTGLCLLALAVYFHLKALSYDVLSVSWIPIVSVMVYAAVFKVGLGIVPIVVTSEIFPAKMKAIGMTVADAMYVIGSIVGLQIYQWLYGSYGLYVPFYVFSVCCFLITLFTIAIVPETKGKTLEEIQNITEEVDHSKLNTIKKLNKIL